MGFGGNSKNRRIFSTRKRSFIIRFITVWLTIINAGGIYTMDGFLFDSCVNACCVNPTACSLGINNFCCPLGLSCCGLPLFNLPLPEPGAPPPLPPPLPPPPQILPPIGSLSALTQLLCAPPCGCAPCTPPIFFAPLSPPPPPSIAPYVSVPQILQPPQPPLPLPPANICAMPMSQCLIPCRSPPCNNKHYNNNCCGKCFGDTDDMDDLDDFDNFRRRRRKRRAPFGSMEEALDEEERDEDELLYKYAARYAAKYAGNQRRMRTYADYCVPWRERKKHRRRRAYRASVSGRGLRTSACACKSKQQVNGTRCQQKRKIMTMICDRIRRQIVANAEFGR